MTAHRYETFEAALDEAIRILQEKFDEADPRAAIELASLLYGMQERERFTERAHDSTEMPYRT